MSKKNEQTTTEEALAQSKALLSSIGDSIIATGDDGRIKFINTPVCGLLGYSEKELIGAWFPEKIVAVQENGKRIEFAERPIARAILSGSPVTERGWYLKKDGSKVPVSITVAPVILKNRPVGAVETIRDITDELKNESLKDEFISVASHQLRTPLSAIKIHSEILSSGLRGDLSELQTTSMQNIVLSANRMAGLIDTLLNIARIESGRTVVTNQIVDAVELVSAIVDEVNLHDSDNRITVQLKVPKTSVEAVHSDPVLLHEAISNLVSNAVKYTPKNGRVAVSVHQKLDSTIVRVVDTGFGIPKTEQENIYTKFYRGSNIIAKDTTGTGLGLYMVKKIIENLGAKITFKSIQNKGTTFEIILKNNA